MHQTQNQLVTRKLSDPFFQTPIGKIVADAICNDFTYILNKEDILVVGTVWTNNVEIMYNKNQIKPVVKSNPIRYEDYLISNTVHMSF